MLKSVVLLAGAVFFGSANATVINVDYLFDGTNLTSVHGNELIGTELSVGDTLNLSYKAIGEDSYWDFSSIYSEGNVNLGFEYPNSCGRRSSHGSYSAYLDGGSVLSNSYSNSYQSCIHAGPNYINFSSVSMLDEFSISYVLDYSSASENVIGAFANNTWWQVWELFDGSKASFNYVPDAKPTNVSEPRSLAILGLGLISVGLMRRRFKK